MPIYLDNAATTPLDPKVLEAMLPYMTEHYGNPSSIHALGRKARMAIEKARRTVAQHLNASTGEIFFTSCATESTHLAFTGAVNDLGVHHIITSPIEHHCILHTAEHLQHTQGIHVHFVRLLANGHIDVGHLATLLQQLEGKEKVMVSLMHGNNEIGNLLDLEVVSVLCQKHDAYFHSDTVQTMAYYPIDVQKTKIHFLQGSAHKFYGPKGIGFIYINSDSMIKPVILGGSQERNMRSGTESVFNIVGLAKAMDLGYENIAATSQHLYDLKHYLADTLKKNVPGVTFNGDYAGQSMNKVLSVSFPPAIANELLLLNLDIAGVCASGGSACSSGVDVGSHVLGALNVPADRHNIRFSFSKFNTKAEIDTAVEKLMGILKIQSQDAA